MQSPHPRDEILLSSESETCKTQDCREKLPRVGVQEILVFPHVIHHLGVKKAGDKVEPPPIVDVKHEPPVDHFHVKPEVQSREEEVDRLDKRDVVLDEGGEDAGAEDGLPGSILCRVGRSLHIMASGLHRPSHLGDEVTEGLWNVS